MISLDFETVVMFDVDETLVEWDKNFSKPGRGKIKFKDPYTNDFLYLKPHNPHIRLLKQYVGRKFAVVVWSMAGQKWSKSVVETLGLTDYVTIVMSKPTRHVDDKTDVKDIIGTRVYLKNDK